jgi:4,5-DOPA dioxygenase extradiol
MFPAADVPVFQLSIDYTRPPAFHYELGKQLSFLRERGVLIVGSGNIVHNLRLARWDSPKPYDWAAEFDEAVKAELNRGSFEALINYHRFGQAAELAVPTNEHYLPLLYALGAAAANTEGAANAGDEITIFNDAFDLASISMTSIILR